jgi:MOSC domain-containing protein
MGRNGGDSVVVFALAMRVSELWRYPVKSLRGESLDEARLTSLGIAGDRLVHARRPDGRVFTARTHPGMLGLEGSLGPDGAPLIDGVRWNLPEALGAVRAVTSPDAELVLYEGDGPQRFDVLPISLATDGGVAAVGVDRRRFRANIYLSGVDGLTERDWVGREVRVGGAVVGVRQVRGRCVMTTYHPDTLEQDISVLQKIYWELGGRTALDCYVLEPGRIRVGDKAEVGDFWTLPHGAAAAGSSGRT